eukprot:UN30680
MKQYVDHIWTRALQMSKNYVQKYKQAVALRDQSQDYEFPRVELFSISLDCQCALIEANGLGLQKHLTQEFLGMLSFGVTHKSTEVRRVVFGMLGVLLGVYPKLLEPHLDKLIQCAIKNLHPHIESLCMNASWFLGECTNRSPLKIKPHLSKIIQHLAGIINMPEPPILNVPRGAIKIGPSPITFRSAALT